ncbi:MAG: cell division protein FtsL [Firmicutes bacterium]|nr:cell division protein FtsL [Bacillota bacterium]
MIVAREQVQDNYGVPSASPREDKRKRSSLQAEHLSMRHRLISVGLIALTFVVGITISFYYAQVYITNYRIQNTQKQLAVLQQETDALYSDLAELSSLERVERVAISELGMVRPDGSDVVKLDMNNKAPIHSNQTTSLPGQTVRLNEPEEKTEARTPREKNWVIQAFSDLVKQVEEGVPSR